VYDLLFGNAYGLYGEGVMVVVVGELLGKVGAGLLKSLRNGKNDRGKSRSLEL
jgi:hypothetical protein